MEVQSPAAMKRHYDITMSRRTRKQSFPVQANNEKTKPLMSDTATKDNNIVVGAFDQTPTSHHIPEVKESTENNYDHKSLKQLINGDEKKDDDATIITNSGRNSLGEHFNEEEKQLQLVLVPQKDDKNNNNHQGLKFKKLVRRYAKVLGHLIKAKRDPHLGEASGKKTIFKLST